MTAEEIVRRRDELAASRGPWRSDNLRLAAGVFTIGEDVDGNAARVRRTVQTVLDLSAFRKNSLRVLDLGCGEGGAALELGKQGFEVVGIEGRPAAAEKAEFAREALALNSVSIVQADVRRLSVEEYGYFDVVLAIGLLDRLDAPAVFELLKQVGAVCTGFALIEAELAERPRATHEIDGVAFRGAPGREQGFLLTRTSMLALLARSGFTSIAETLDPVAASGTPCFAAWKGRRAALLTIPQANAVVPRGWTEESP